MPINENGMPNATHRDNLKERKKPSTINTKNKPIKRFLLKVSILWSSISANWNKVMILYPLFFALNVSI